VEAIILAGGLGTRLQGVINDVPKPMAPINGIPFLEYILKTLKAKKITKVILSVGYKWEVISDYFGKEFEGMLLQYSVEEEPLGTGGAIKKAIALVTQDIFFIINGDTFFNIDLYKMMQNFKGKSLLRLALKSMSEFDRYGCVEINKQGFVTAFTEKGFRKKGNINGGIYLVRHNIFDSFELPVKFSFEQFVEKSFKVLGADGLVCEGYFIDIGIPEDFDRAQVELENYI